MVDFNLDNMYKVMNWAKLSLRSKGFKGYTIRMRMDNMLNMLHIYYIYTWFVYVLYVHKYCNTSNGT